MMRTDVVSQNETDPRKMVEKKQKDITRIVVAAIGVGVGITIAKVFGVFK